MDSSFAAKDLQNQNEKICEILTSLAPFSLLQPLYEKKELEELFKNTTKRLKIAKEGIEAKEIFEIFQSKNLQIEFPFFRNWDALSGGYTSEFLNILHNL